MMFTRFAGGASKLHQSYSVSPFFSFLLCKIGNMTRISSSIAYPFVRRDGAYPFVGREWLLSLCGKSMELLGS
jgi:hypothetical protein